MKSMKEQSTLNMQKKQSLTTIVMLIVLACLTSSCKSPKFKNEIRRVWSRDFQTCFCQNYDLNQAKKIDDLVPCEDFFIKFFPEVPVFDNNFYCSNLIGFDAEAVAKRITPKAREIIRYYEDNK